MLYFSPREAAEPVAITTRLRVLKLALYDIEERI